jgi:acetyl-CoA C-acetyltransferase
MADSRDVVLIGAAQLCERPRDDRDLGAELARIGRPMDLLERVARAAGEDAGIGARALARLDTVALVQIMGWAARNPPRALAERLGAAPVRELTTGVGGETPLVLVNDVARRIARGESELAFVGGSHVIHALRSAHRLGLTLDLGPDAGGEPDFVVRNRRGSSEREDRYGINVPMVVYPMFGNALRARRGLDLDSHGRFLGRLMTSFTEVAARNPHAWFPVVRGADELVRPDAENRMIAFPYPKYLNAVMDTNQAAGVLLASREEALRLGVEEERLVYWWGGGSTAESPWYFTERADLARCPSLTRAVEEALAEAASELGRVTRMDLYSCFPSAVEMACLMLGLPYDDPRGFTVTGGLPYAGGPGNNYCTHALAAMVQRLRDEGGSGLVTGNGWYFTKHSALVCGTDPRRGPPRVIPEPPPPVSGPEIVDEVGSAAGTVETYTVVYGRDGAPARGRVVGRLEDGRRFLAGTPKDRKLLEDLVAREAVGRGGRVTSQDGRNRFVPL